MSDDDPARGGRDPIVTVVVFGDLESSYTARAMPWLSRVLDEHQADLRLVWKHLPLDSHPNALRAARLATAAHTLGRFWPAQVALSARRRELASIDATELAAAIGLDADALAAALQSPATSRAVDADLAQARKLGLAAAPTVFVNGRRLVGLRSYEQLQTLVQEELTKAQAMVKRGISRSSVYFQVMARATAPE